MASVLVQTGKKVLVEKMEQLGPCSLAQQIS